jgi:cell wall-associated NlpC family hydrolase
MPVRPRLSHVSVLLATVLVLGSAPAFADHDDDDEPAPPPPSEEPAVTYDDIADQPWAKAAIWYTAVQRDWLRFDGPLFRPDRPLERWQLARAAVRAFAPATPLDPEITFSDLLPEAPAFDWANKAVSLGWIPKADTFDPTGTVNKRLLMRVLVLGLGLSEPAKSLNHLATEDGYAFDLPPSFAFLVLGNELHLNPNFESPNDRRDLLPSETVTRGYAAVAFKRAAQVGWEVWEAQRFIGITLPKMSPKRRSIVEFALQYVGYPYIYAAEWYRATGSQPKGGFDCSGFQWWVAHDASAGFDNTHVRPYRGWNVNQRRASLIAREAARDRRVWRANNLIPGDLVFFDAGTMPENWHGIDHGGMALGGGWFIHSSGSRAGVTIGYLGDGSWWSDSFVMGRRMFGALPGASA